jgi:hypothetical protein
MLEYMGKESGVVPKTLIMKTVTYLPWANRHHVCGTLKALEMNGSIKRKEGLLY